MQPAGQKNSLKRLMVRVQLWTREHIPPGLRLVVGLALMVGGVLGFLPVLGFWMLPLGIAVAALDIVPIYRRLSGKDPRTGEDEQG